MPRAAIEKIRESVRARRYDVTIHAIEEMAEDGLTIEDVEHAVLNGHLTRTEKDDPRGNKSVVEGHALDRTTRVGVVGRFTENDRFLIITVYAIT
jgi:Domain of unknown function (DUF4258)